MICSSCAQDNVAGATHCAKCGKQLSAPVIADTIKPRRQGLGVFLIILPFVSLIIILSAFAITQFVVNQLISSSPSTMGAVGLGVQDPRETTANIIRIVLSFLGILAVLSFFVCIPLGIIMMLRRKASYPEGSYDARSGKGPQSVVPEEIRGWSWGAAGLGWIWGGCNNVWIAFLNWVPIVNIFFWIVLGIKGNEWAWRKNQWRSVDEFKAVQGKWGSWGLVFFVLWVLTVLISMFNS